MATDITGHFISQLNPTEVNGTEVLAGEKEGKDVKVTTQQLKEFAQKDVVKDPHYVHTDNNFTQAEKEKLAGLTPGGGGDTSGLATKEELNLKADKTEIPTKTSELQNDSNFVADPNYHHTDNNFTNEEKQKLGSIVPGEGGGAVSVPIDTLLDETSTNAKAAGAKAVVDKLAAMATHYEGGIDATVSERPQTILEVKDVKTTVFALKILSQTCKTDNIYVRGEKWDGKIDWLFYPVSQNIIIQNAANSPYKNIRIYLEGGLVESPGTISISLEIGNTAEIAEIRRKTIVNTNDIENNSHNIGVYLELIKSILYEKTSVAGIFSLGKVIEPNTACRIYYKSASFTGTANLTIIVSKDGVDGKTIIKNATAPVEGYIDFSSDSTSFNELKIWCTSQLEIDFFETPGRVPTGKDLFSQIESIKKGKVQSPFPSDDYGISGESILNSNDQYVDRRYMRIVMLDNNYKFFNVVNIKRIIDEMAAVGLNYLELGFGGSGHGWSFRLDDMNIHSLGRDYVIPVVSDYGQALTEADMADIITYGRGKGIEIIPSIDMPGHMTALLSSYPKFCYKNAASALNIYDERACDYALTILDRYAKWFADRGCQYINICADEFYDAINGYVKLFDEGDYEYAHFINRMALCVAKYGFSVMCWNDPIAMRASSVPRQNHKMIVNYWMKRDAWCSAAKIRELGFNLINSTAGIYWVVREPEENAKLLQKINSLNIHIFSDGSTIPDSKGVKFCVWIGKSEEPSLNDNGDNITNEILPLIKAFGERINAQLAQS